MSGLEKIATPFLALDLDIFDRNLERMQQSIVENGLRWRPHVKSIKTPAIIDRLQAAGAEGVTCAKVSEAEVMVDAGIQDILIANQIVSPQAIQRLAMLNGKARVITAIDSLKNAEDLSKAAAASGVKIPVVIEVDIGLARAGVMPGQPVVDLAGDISSLPGIEFLGVMGWEGHATRIKDVDAKFAAVKEATEQLVNSARSCDAAGFKTEIVSCGGTGTYWMTAKCPGVTEIQAGGGVFCDIQYHDNFGVPHEYALTVWTTVCSRPNDARIVVDTGWKSMSAYPVEPKPLGLGKLKRVGLSAEHTTIELADPADEPKIGDRIQFIVGYADSTVFLHEKIYAVQQDTVFGVWPIEARGMTT
jgi:D-serine deaminase-like pyridoxal phosphate-dependent protein